MIWFFKLIEGYVFKKNVATKSLIINVFDHIQDQHAQNLISWFQKEAKCQDYG